MKNLKDKYTVKKSIRFELKAVHNRGENHKDNVNFQTTSNWLEEKFFKNSFTNSDENKDIKGNLENIFGEFLRLKGKLCYTLQEIGNKSISPFCVLIKAPLLEHLDTNLFHEQKKKNRFNQTKFIPLSHLKIDNYNWFLSGMKKKIWYVEKFELLIKNHYEQIENRYQETLHHSRLNKDIESFCNRYLELLELFQYITIPNDNEIKEFNTLNEEQKNIFTKIESLKDFLKEDFVSSLKIGLEEIKESIKNSQFIECGLVSLNDRALNKNPEKVKSEEEWLEETEGKQKQLLQEIRQKDYERKIVLDGDKSRNEKGLYQLLRAKLSRSNSFSKNKKGLYQLLREESKSWAKSGQDTCREYSIHLLNSTKYNQDIHEKIEEIQKLRSEQKELKEKTQKTKDDGNRIKNLSPEISDKQREIDKLKIEKRLIQDRKKLFLEKNILSCEIDKKRFKGIDKILEQIEKNKNNKDKKAKLLNFQNVWKTNNKYEKGNECNIKISKDLWNLLKNNQNLIIKKRKLSQKYGDNKSLVNSLQREIERQRKIEHQAILIKDKHFYYLAFLERENRRSLKRQFFQENNNGEYYFLKYERLTFKALEKLALIENATFNKFDELEDEKYRYFKEYRLNNKDKQQKIKDKIINLLTKVIKKLGYEFYQKNNYETLDDFAEDVNKQCYEIKWISFDWEKLLEGERQGKIKLFKIHNKDFSRDKREYANKKNNLFTEYWLDLFERNNQRIRILPEIDLYKKPKEKDDRGSPVKNSQGKELEGTIKGKRFRENKFYASFRLEFYPEPEKKVFEVEEFNEELRESVKTEKKYFLGLDRGENELVTYCLIDEQGNIVLDENQNPIIGDWNIDSIEAKNEKKRKNDYRKHFEKYTKTRKELLEKYNVLKFENDEDEKEIEDLEKKENEKSIICAEKIKEGFCGHLLREINKIMKEFKNVYIVLEDLDKEQENKELSNKEDILQKTLGGSVYQVIEDAIISKFKYYYTKDKEFEGSQIVPNVERIQDLRVLKDFNSKRNKFGRIRYLKSKDQIGNILFVDDFMTSQMCPDCGFCICRESDGKRLPKFAQDKSISKDFIEKNKAGAQVEKVGENYKVNLAGMEYIIKQTSYLKDKYKNNCEEVKEKLRSLLIPRLKASKSNCYRDKDLKKDPFYCAKCGKNTDESFKQSLKSGDDIAAYNISMRGIMILDKIESKREEEVGFKN